MTLLDDRPGQVPRRSASFLADIDEVVDRMLAAMQPGPAVSVARALFAEVVGIYRRVLEEHRGVLPAQRAQVRAAGQEFAAAGGSPDTVADMLGRLASHLISRVAAQRPEQVVSLVDVAHLVVRDFLTGVAEPQGTADLTKETRWNLVQRLVLDGEIPPELVSTLDAGYVVAVLRFPQRVPQDRLMALLEEHGADGVLSAPAEEGAIMLVPERAEGFFSRVVTECAARFGVLPWLSTAGRRPRAEVAAGYQEAKDILALALATEQEPGRFRLDDFLVEYAIVSDPVVSRRLMSVIEPLLDHEVLRETLEVLIRTDFNRTAAARDLFVHRSTLDYRIRKIEEMTGHGPMTSRGAYILRVAMAAHLVAGTAKV
jgi:hypothetical protein